MVSDVSEDQMLGRKNPTHLVVALSQGSQREEDKTEHHAQTHNPPSDVVVFEQSGHTARASNVNGSEASSVDEDVKPEPSCDPSMVQHQAVHTETSHDGQGSTLACHQDQEGQLSDTKNGSSIGQMTADLVALSSRSRVESVVGTDVEIVEGDEGKEVKQRVEEDNDSLASQRKLKGEPLNEGERDYRGVLAVDQWMLKHMCPKQSQLPLQLGMERWPAPGQQVVDASTDDEQQEQAIDQEAI